ncbi:MAG: HAD-IC family P-type ATPase [Pseudomonadota bacterium]
MDTQTQNINTLSGLTDAEAQDRLTRYGENRLPEPKSAGPITVFLRQFLSPFIYILLAAALVSLAVDQLPSAIFIFAVLLLNATIGAVQEVSAERSAAALRSMVKGVAHVIRGGRAVKIPIEELVPGDLVVLASGDRAPADIRLIEADTLQVDESMLTGESVAVVKQADDDAPHEGPLAGRTAELFAGSIVTRGRARGLVTATALSTQIGKIAEKVTARRVSEPPLMIRIRRFTYQVAGAIGIAILALVALMALRGGYEWLAIIMMVIGLAVSTIPEGLPAALTVALAIGMRRMAQNNVIIRKLVAVEALGSCTFICSDKTGTLTVNELTIHSALLPSGRSFTASGAGIAPGAITGEAPEALRELCVTGVLANESWLDYAGENWNADGDIVDVAFMVFAKKYGLSLSGLRDAHRRTKLIPYESERAFSGSVNADEAGEFLYVKGSPEKILAASSLMRTEDGGVLPIDRAHIEAQFNDLARQGYRVIALARREAVDEDGDGEPDLDQLIFLGLVAMIDPVRPEAKTAIQACRTGGISVAMVTGDHPATARAIGAELGLCSEDDAVVTGPMLREAQSRGDAAVRALVLPARVFARIEPIQKELIVQTFMQDGNFVAVTGDGVNDAPAMRRANAGVAMGRTGTDVAKEAADLIITDDNFASIVSGVEQGRIVYNNILKVIALLTATGFSAILLFLLAVAFGLPMPLTAVQLLWLNLVANGMQDVALAFEPKEGDELEKAPRDPSEPIFGFRVIEHVLVAGSTMGLIAFTVYASALTFGLEHAMAQNVTLMLMVLFGNVHALSSRSETRSIFAMKYWGNPFLAIAVPGAFLIHILALHTPGLSGVLGLAPIPLDIFVWLVGAALAFLVVEEVHKFVTRRLQSRDKFARHRDVSNARHSPAE